MKIGNFCPKETLDSSNKGVKERKGERAKERKGTEQSIERDNLFRSPDSFLFLSADAADAAAAAPPRA